MPLTGLVTAMIKHLRRGIILTGLLMSLSVAAQDTGVKAAVTISVQQGQEIWTGQQVTLNLDLKTTGFSFSDSHFNLPEVNGAFLMQTDTTTVKLTEKTDGLDWQIVRYPLALYPQKSGQLEIPSIRVRFSTSAGFGSTQKAFEFQTRPLKLTIKLPPGVKQGDLVVTTTSFQLDHDWQPESATAYPGDALTLTVRRSATDISAMLLPPLPVFRTGGLAAYPQAPEVNDKTDRGDLTGERIDRIIWVVEKPGTYDIPGIRFHWWDPASHELKQQVVPGMSLNVLSSRSDNNVAGSVEKPGQDYRGPLPVLLFALAVLLAAALWWHLRRRLRDQHLINEKSTFAMLQKACRSNQAVQTHAAIYTWLANSSLASREKSEAVTMSEFARIVNDKQLRSELEQLQRAIVSADNDWQGGGLLSSLKRVRHEINSQKIVQSKVHLAPLNP